MGRQHDEDKVEQKKSEVRMNRWYNRLLNRHQDDPVSRVPLHTYNNKHHYILTLSLHPLPSHHSSYIQLVLMERRRNQFRQRPNLGTALAGLAREPHPAGTSA